MAGVVFLAFLAVGLAQRQAAAWLGASGLFALYFGAGLFRLPRGPGWLDALPWLIFAAPLTPLVMALRPAAEPLDGIGLRELAQVGGTLLVAHLLLLRLAARARAGGVTPPHAGDAEDRRVARGMALLTGLSWCGATALLILRFRLFQTAGHPEDTAFLWDCFRHWQAGHGAVSPWVVAWGHPYPTHYFALHFSPGLYAFFGLARFLPHLATLIVLQNLAVLLGLALLARTLAYSSARPHPDGRHDPDARPRPLFPGATAWFLAILVASPPLNSALRTDLHPILWSLPFLGLVHLAYDRRRPLLFLVAGLLLFTLREDLGWVWGMYAPLAWLEGRRRARDAFWLAAPLVGFAGTLIIQQLVIPRFGIGEGPFFQLVFGTEARGLVAFLISLLGQPAELFRRLFRPGNLVLGLRLLATGAAWPVGSWRWLPALPLLAIFSLVEPGTQLLNLSGHYVTVPAFFLLAGGLAALLPRLARWDAPRRGALLVTLWALSFCQPAPPELPPVADLRAMARIRREVAEDVALIEPGRSAWVPGNLLLATSDPELAVPIHRMAVMSLPPGGPRTPTQALIPNAPEVTADRIQLLSGRYGPFERTKRGHGYDLYELVRR